jgi:N-acetyl-beta-hexosaminidase
METHKEEIELTRATLKVQKKQIIAKNMNLSSMEKDKFWAVYREYQEKMDAVANRRVKVITDYADTLKDGSLTNEKAMDMLNEYLSYERMRLITKQSYVKKFQEVLPSLKVVRFFQIENKLEAIINMQLAKQIPLMR